MSKQAEALAAEIAMSHCGGRHVGVEGMIADIIDAVFNPPCPECGAAIAPSIKWACGSWQDGPARQVSVKCVKRQMAKLSEKGVGEGKHEATLREIARVERDEKPDGTILGALVYEADEMAALAREAIGEPVLPVDPHDGPAVAELPTREPPDAMPKPAGPEGPIPAANPWPANRPPPDAMR